MTSGNSGAQLAFTSSSSLEGGPNLPLVTKGASLSLSNRVRCGLFRDHRTLFEELCFGPGFLASPTRTPRNPHCVTVLHTGHDCFKRPCLLSIRQVSRRLDSSNTYLTSPAHTASCKSEWRSNCSNREESTSAWAAQPREYATGTRAA